MSLNELHRSLMIRHFKNTLMPQRRGIPSYLSADSQNQTRCAENKVIDKITEDVKKIHVGLIDCVHKLELVWLVPPYPPSAHTINTSLHHLFAAKWLRSSCDCGLSLSSFLTLKSLLSICYLCISIWVLFPVP